MWRTGLVLVLLAGCGASASGPAWPRASADGHDGGESLSPRAPPSIAEKGDDDDDDDDAGTSTTPVADTAAKPAQPAAAPAPTPAASTDSATSAAEEPIFINEEIVIEIDE